jgi:hypothetical protein
MWGWRWEGCLQAHQSYWVLEPFYNSRILHIYKPRRISINTFIQTVQSATKGHNYLNAIRKESVTEVCQALHMSGIGDLITENIQQKHTILWRER